MMPKCIVRALMVNDPRNHCGQLINPVPRGVIDVSGYVISPHITLPC